MCPTTSLKLRRFPRRWPQWPSDQPPGFKGGLQGWLGLGAGPRWRRWVPQVHICARPLRGPPSATMPSQSPQGDPPAPGTSSLSTPPCASQAQTQVFSTASAGHGPHPRSPRPRSRRHYCAPTTLRLLTGSAHADPPPSPQEPLPPTSPWSTLAQLVVWNPGAEAQCQPTRFHLLGSRAWSQPGRP